jgi:hypothetical protein
MKTISHQRTVRSGTTADSLLHRPGKLRCLTANAAGSAATGPTKGTKLLPDKFHGTVKITLDLHPATMSFDLPWHFLPDEHHVGIALIPTRP